MTDSIEVMVARIDARTENIEKSMVRHDADLIALHKRSHDQARDLNQLKGRCDERTKGGDCPAGETPAVEAAGQPLNRAIMRASGVSSGLTLAVLVIVLIILKYVGLLG